MDQIKTLCFDGDKFWMSGQCKKIYIWKEETGEIIFLDSLPDDFGVWNFTGKYQKLLSPIETNIDMPLFISSIAVGRYIWFIPYQTNEILYVDKDTYGINVFSIREEIQTEKEVETQLLKHKYLLEYVRNDRYIGLFSLKNKWMFEIDCQELRYEILDYKVNSNIISQIEEHFWIDSIFPVFYQKNTISEQGKLTLETLMRCIKLKDYKQLSEKEQDKKVVIGKSIHLSAERWI